MTKKDRPDHFTTFQVAQHFGVSAPTVINWVNKGLLQAHRTPGGHRRIRGDEIVAFSRRYNYPLSEAFLGARISVQKVLIVDEKVDVAEVVSEFLTVKGYLTEWAGSGFQAGYQLAQFSPDLVIVDVTMADFNGFDMVQFLRAQSGTRHLLVIGVGNYSDPELDARMDPGVFDAWVTKPIKLKQLVAMVVDLLQTPVR